MIDCEVLLTEAIAKKDAAFERESRHAVAATVLSEAVVHVIEAIAPVLGPAMSLPRADKLLRCSLRELIHAHEQSIIAQDGKSPRQNRWPSTFNGTTPYVWATLEDYK